MMMMMVMVKAFARGGGRTEPSGAGVCVSRLVTCSRTELYSQIWAIAPMRGLKTSKSNDFKKKSFGLIFLH